jgi:CBS domain-containing protein
MRVAEVMTKHVQTITPDTPAADAYELMRRQGIRHLVVMDQSSVVGVLSDRDAGGRFGAGLRAAARVADLMSRTVVTVDPEFTVRQTANLMRGRSIGCVPVLKKGRQLIGIVTVSDLLEVLGRGIDRPATPSRPAVHYRVPHRRQRAASGKW